MSNNYTRAIRAVASENGPQLGPGEAPPTNNANSIDVTMDTVVFTLNWHQRNANHTNLTTHTNGLHNELPSQQYNKYVFHNIASRLYAGPYK